MFRKYDPITGVLVYEVDPLPMRERFHRRKWLSGRQHIT